MKAFQTLDTEGQGYLTQEQLTKLMMEEGLLIRPSLLHYSLLTDLNPLWNVTSGIQKEEQGYS